MTNLGWYAWLGPRSTVNAIQQAGTDAANGLINPRLPARLEHGEEVNFQIDEDIWLANIERRGFAPDQLMSKVRLEKLRFVVHTSVGKAIRVRPEQDLLDAMWKRQSAFFAREGRTPAAD